ncbi:hypothetical protein DYBT9275_04017 [Dyadobacter sp. CECT 9275]|uniref:Protein-glutamine gamma-glutamyltransferase-like C-terminal domain-containing protein n=1 Tax=Dyadobacter helix TaxID=2822344 RepID=A0A916N5X4_9BACT|nr:DUF4129 domain-containing protein [Dyadobacter sp. CECT 9275]CAG5007303.1 hypothetical protein DYBT9275_04017 [Dyadobacter sp. CECT 9275]
MNQVSCRKDIYTAWIRAIWLLIGQGVVLCWPLTVLAQKDSVIAIPQDQAKVNVWRPEPALIEDFRNDSDYNYEDVSPPPENPFLRWIDWALQKINSFFQGKSYQNFWQYVIMAVVAGLVLFFLYKTKALNFIFPASRTTEPTDYTVGHENIHEIDFEDAILKALSAHDFRLAIRLQYLKTLKFLANRQLIHWSPNRTNQTYVQELTGQPFRDDFVRLTRFFEFVWYGDFQINESAFLEMKSFSTAIQDKLNRR